VLDFLLGALVLAGLYGILAVSLHLQFGETGLLDFGLAGFFGIGAYATSIGAAHGLSWPLGMAIGMVLAALAGAAVGLLGRTLTAEYWAIATLALAELVRLVALNASFTGGTNGLSTARPFFTGISDPTLRDAAWLLTAASVLALCALVAWRITGTQFGRVLRMVREQEQLAASLAHDVVGAKVRAMAVSAPMAALAGSLYTHYISFVGPGDIDPFLTFIVFTMVVVGGLGRLWGVVLGAVLVQLLYDATRYLGDVVPISPNAAGGLRILIIGGALLGFLLFRPGGLLPERRRSFDAAR
jgi:branched-chain amino acid transport system permease protein